MKKALLTIFIALFTGILLQDCSTSKVGGGREDKSNLASIYDPGATKIHPDFQVHHVTDSLSHLYMRLSENDVKFSDANPGGELISRIRVHYNLTRRSGPLNTRSLADSGTFVFDVNRSGFEDAFYARIPIKTPEKDNYEMQVFSYDLFNNNSNIQFLPVEKRTFLSGQNFRVLNPSNHPYFTHVFDSTDEVIITHRDRNYDIIHVSYYKDKEPLPRPVFYPEAIYPDYDLPDSTFLMSFSGRVNLKLKQEGIYHFRLDTSGNDGLTLCNFGMTFPELKTPDDLLEPLAYIATSAEMKELKSSLNKKVAVDNFWLDAAGSSQIAKNLIRIYYNRVKYANLYFTTDREGWRTDRGMVYVVYGIPNSIYKSDIEERWVYIRKPDAITITFTFLKEENKLAPDSYVLMRDPSANSFWRRAVDSWRDGEVFSMD